jgi:hypothetical protein
MKLYSNYNLLSAAWRKSIAAHLDREMSSKITDHGTHASGQWHRVHCLNPTVAIMHVWMVILSSPSEVYINTRVSRSRIAKKTTKFNTYMPWQSLVLIGSIILSQMHDILENSSPNLVWLDTLNKGVTNCQSTENKLNFKPGVSLKFSCNPYYNSWLAWVMKQSNTMRHFSFCKLCASSKSQLSPIWT